MICDHHACVPRAAQRRDALASPFDLVLNLFATGGRIGGTRKTCSGSAMKSAIVSCRALLKSSRAIAAGVKHIKSNWLGGRVEVTLSA
jgi:hypothetical protein